MNVCTKNVIACTSIRSRGELCFGIYIVFIMSSDLKKVNRELLEDFIRTYQSQLCLWNGKSKDYHDKSKRNVAYNLLLQKYKSIDPNANKDAVVKKINAFRTNYRREKKKIEESRRSGIGTDDVYEPTLWYYNLFEFLGDQETPRSSSSNINEREVSFFAVLYYLYLYTTYILFIYTEQIYLFVRIFSTQICCFL